ncbi:hypothetical protein, partial [Pseudomonas aeruginosa]|uniref:hypothetical protein n=1 Tax=Pseudomonas aeruginosa TaxID=287 RepID=UPI003003E701
CPWRTSNNRRAVIRHFGEISADDAVGVMRPTELSDFALSVAYVEQPQSGYPPFRRGIGG